MAMKDYLFIDIETVPACAQYDQLSEKMQAFWTKKSSKHFDLPADESFEKHAGIYAEFGKVVCIGLGYLDQQTNSFRIKTLADHDEQKILTQLADVFDKSKRKILVGHNIKEFDVPFLCRRMLIHQVALPNILQLAGKKPWEVAHIDTLELWKFGDWKNFTSLDLLATLFGVPSSKEIISGAQVGQVYYQSHDLELIARYCASDVLTTARVFTKMQGLPPIEDDQVVYL